MSAWQRGGNPTSNNVASDDGPSHSGGGCGEDAACQVLQHLTLEAVVISRMSRAAGYCRRIDVMMQLRAVRVAVASRMRLRRLCEPRQRTERWPGQRNERDPSDSAAKSPHSGS
jgi:hypothetical protein